MKSDAATPEVRLGYEFDGFVLDPMRRQLCRRDGSLVELTPRVFDALLYFVERPGELLDRERLLQSLWPGLVVEDNNLSQTLSALRRALGDDQLDRYVLTVPRRSADAQPSTSPSSIDQDSARQPSASESGSDSSRISATLQSR